MKALSLKQPWAELVVSGRKTIELRKWNTNFRGRFLVHASSTPDVKNMKKFGFDELPLGFIVGEAELIGIKRYPEDGKFGEDSGKYLAINIREWGGFGFLLKNARKLEPISAKGSLNFWNCDLKVDK